jgi:hypothetical protein
MLPISCELLGVREGGGELSSVTGELRGQEQAGGSEDIDKPSQSV